jgi:hypothetical protein
MLMTLTCVAVGFAVADLVRLRETGRLRHCEAPGCDAVFVDLSKNRSRRYCDTGNCGNRQHVAAYRERRAARATDRDGLPARAPDRAVPFSRPPKDLGNSALNGRKGGL